MRIAVRLDDITPDMDWKKFGEVKTLLDNAGICPLVGIVPDNKDPNLHKQESKEDFWRYFATLKDKGWSIAQHGYTHIYTTKEGGLFPLNDFSEFAGLSYDKQLYMIKSGKEILRSHGLDTDIFMTPAHSYDLNTLKALKECGFRYVTDGFENKPYMREGLIFLPIPFKISESLKTPMGYTTMVLHVNTMSDDEMYVLKKRLESYTKERFDSGKSTSFFINYSELLKVDYIKRTVMMNADEHMMALIKRGLVTLRSGKTKIQSDTATSNQTGKQTEALKGEITSAVSQEKKAPCRVLHVLGGTALGGAESRIMDLYRHIDREKVQFDFLVHMDPAKYEEAEKTSRNPMLLREPQFYDEEIKKLGGNVYAVPRFNGKNLIQYRKAFARFFACHNGYTVVEGHMTSTAAIYLPIAKSYGIKTTVAHARSAGTDTGIKGTATKLLRSSLYRKSDILFTCSKLAGVSAFGAHTMYYVPNAIDIGRFTYDDNKAAEVRTKLGISDRRVIGHVGRFHYAKNHEYLLDIFREIHQNDKKTVLLLLGEGPLMDMMKAKASQAGISDFVIFAGNIADPAPYYMAMDFFIFPSHFEGLPGTVVEALSSGLPCLISDTIADEVICTPYIRSMSIEHDPKEWADEVLSFFTKDYHAKRLEDASKAPGLMKAAGFDADALASTMQEFYMTGKTDKLKKLEKSR